MCKMKVWGRRLFSGRCWVLCLVRVLQWCQRRPLYRRRLERGRSGIARSPWSMCRWSLSADSPWCLALFMVIYNLVRSWRCWARSSGPRPCLCRSFLSWRLLVSGTDTCRVSWCRRPRTPARAPGRGPPEGRQRYVYTLLDKNQKFKWEESG